MHRRGDRRETLDRLAWIADGRPAAPTPPQPPRPTTRRGRVGRAASRATPFASGVMAVLVALFLYALLVPGQRPLGTTDIDKRVASALASQTPPPPFSAQVYQVIAPSIVLIQVQVPATTDNPTGSGLGTGVVVTDTGAILTCLHVVENATDITLTFADGTTSKATITGSQPENDIAVLTADQPPATLVPATLGDPNIPIGSEAYVVGNPYGLYGSLSAGVISGHGRTFKRPGRDTTISNLIQVDAAVNPGNSGGPLLNRNGEVIGIVLALINPTEENVFIGIGLAVPIDTAGGAAGLPPY